MLDLGCGLGLSLDRAIALQPALVSEDAARMRSPSSRRVLRAVIICSAWVVLDLALFVPSYVRSGHRTAFWPGLRGLALWRANQDVFRISFDLCLAGLLVIWTARRPRLARSVRSCVVTAYLWLLLFLAYHEGVRSFLARTPALGEDWRLALNLVHFLSSMQSVRWFALGLVGMLALVALGFTAAFAVRSLQLAAAHWSRAQCLRWTLVLGMPCLAVLAWSGIQPDEPVVQLLGKRVLANLRASYFEALRLAEVRGAPDRTYDAYSKVELTVKPDVYVWMIEAYGEILATSDMAPAYRALLQRVFERLGAAGYHARSAYSVAPVHGGTSWFSISTLHTGVRIDRPTIYDALQVVGARLPTLTNFFRDHGYATYALQPGNTSREGFSRFDVFNHQVMIDAPRLHYTGHQYGWGHIPDQYSLGRMREQTWPAAASPRYMFYMAVSTHFPWGEDVPPYVEDWHSLSTGVWPQPEAAGAWWDIPEYRAIGSELRRSYFRSVAYEWRLLTEWLESEASKDAVVLILGDHQPRLEDDADLSGVGKTFHTPVHVLSRTAAFVDAFSDVGFDPGLYATPKPLAALRHEGLFSLLVSRLTAAYGKSSPLVRYLPKGIGLAGLSR